MFLAGIHLLRNNGCPIKAFGHDLSLYHIEMKANFLSVPNTIGKTHIFSFDILKDALIPNLSQRGRAHSRQVKILTL
jgi:hypothetical protein